MQLPNADQAHCLNLEHSRGKDKAILFRSRLGITLENKEILEVALFKAAIEENAIIYKEDRYGTHYDIKFLLQTEAGSALVLSCWIIRTDENFPRLTNAYPVDR